MLIERLRKRGVDVRLTDEGELAVETSDPLTDDQRKFISDHRDEIASELSAAHRVWWILHRDGEWREHHMTPAETRAEVRSAYPDALVIMSDREAKADPTKMKMRGGSK